jgi:hypothetical protein
MFWSMQAINAVKEGEDAFQKLGCALEVLPKVGGFSVALQAPTPCVPLTTEAPVPLTGACTSRELPQSAGQSSSSLSGTEEITDHDFKVTGSPAKMPQLANDSGVKSLPTTLEAAAHDLMQHLNQAELNSENTEGALLVEFMTSCVATLFMLQVWLNLVQ